MADSCVYKYKYLDPICVTAWEKPPHGERFPPLVQHSLWIHCHPATRLLNFIFNMFNYTVVKLFFSLRTDLIASIQIVLKAQPYSFSSCAQCCSAIITDACLMQNCGVLLHLCRNIFHVGSWQISHLNCDELCLRETQEVLIRDQPFFVLPPASSSSLALPLQLLADDH